ncbi:MAG: endonuclease/exonuclease/phosphatase family protein [Phycisphaeraceae bacterium]|nr:endonuclease/exonuclease/phosphatase family protein [Phycisphaeraceae bacterium]
MSTSPGPVLNNERPDQTIRDRATAGPRWRRAVSYAASRLMIVAGLGTLAGYFGSLWWVLDLSAHFRVQYVIALIIAAVLLAVLRRFVAAGVMVLLAGVNLATVVMAIMPVNGPATSSASAASPRPLRLMQFNVHTSNRRYDGVASYIDQSGVDVVFLQEVDDAWAAAMQRGLSRYRPVVVETRGDNFGIAMFLRADAEDGPVLLGARAIDLGDVGVPVIDARLRWQGQVVAMLSVHTLPPVSPGYAAIRDRQLLEAADWAARQKVPVIVSGDLNATPWSAGFAPLEARGELINSMRGQGLGRSWPAHAGSIGWVLRIPIDHCLHSSQWRVESRRLGPGGLGSDHRPLLVDLSLAADATATTNP